MATRLKHMQRSHRSYRKGFPEGMFARNAARRTNGYAMKERGTFLQKLFHRRTNLSGNIVPKEETDG